MPDDNSVYDIRLRDHYTTDNPLTQAEFENSHKIINRTLFLIGDLPFQNLFTFSLDQILQHLFTNISNRDRFLLLEDSISIETLEEDLRNLEAEALPLAEETVQQPISSAIGTLRQLAIQVPDFRANTAQKQQAVAQLLASPAASLTYRDLFEMTRTELEQELPGALQTVIAAQEVDVFDPPPNGKCCDGTGTCIESLLTHFCAPATGGGCVAAATPCAGIEEPDH